MAKLTDEVKSFIVQSLACYDTPSQAADAVYEHFELKIERTHTQQVNPSVG